MARRCCEVWLRSIASTLTGDAKELIATAADLYGEAFRYYDRYRSEDHGTEASRLTLQQRARTPERTGAAPSLLKQAIAEETAGLEALAEAVHLLE